MRKEEQKKEVITEEKINGEEGVNAQKLLKDVEKIRKELLKDDPKRFEEDETS